MRVASNCTMHGYLNNTATRGLRSRIPILGRRHIGAPAPFYLKPHGAGRGVGGRGVHMGVHLGGRVLCACALLSCPAVGQVRLVFVREPKRNEIRTQGDGGARGDSVQPEGNCRCRKLPHRCWYLQIMRMSRNSALATAA